MDIMDACFFDCLFLCSYSVYATAGNCIGFIVESVKRGRCVW